MHATGEQVWGLYLKLFDVHPVDLFSGAVADANLRGLAQAGE